MSDTSLVFNFLKGRDTASPAMRSVANESTSMASRIRTSSIISVAATAAMYTGFAALGAEGIAAVSALAPLAGLVATLPALAIGAASGIGVLMMATSGLAAAMKQSSGGAASNGQAIVAAERRVESAQRSATQAQNDLNAARQTAAEKLADVQRELNRAALDEKAATMAVADAAKQLREARATGNRDDIAHAQLGYEEAVQSLEEIKDRTADVRKEDEHRVAVGVEGSDEVQTALQRQADALQQLADAQAALKTAGSGGGGVDAAAEAYAKLSPAGKALVDVLKQIAPAWRTVQQAVQQSVFAGVAGDIKQLSTVYLPVMRQQLPAIGQGWNNAFRGTAQLAATAGFVDDVNTTLGNTATFWQRIGQSFAPFLSGFRQFAVVGSAFLPGFGAWVLKIGNAFNVWATNARETGKAHDWIANSLVVLGQVWEIAKNLGTSIAAIFRAGDAGPGFLPGVVAGTAALSAFLNSPAGQGKLAAVFSTLRDVASQVWAVLTNVGPALLDFATSAGGTATDTVSVFGTVVGFAADHLETLAKWMPVIIGAFVLYKAAQSAAVVVDLVRTPVIIAQTIANLRLGSSMRANTAALIASTATQATSTAATEGLAVATVAGSTAAEGATVAQWLLNAAMWAFPVLLIIAGIALIIAGFVLLWNHSAGFRDFWIGLWDHIWSFLKMIGSWFAGPFVDFFVGAWNWIKNAFNDAVNWIAGKVAWVVNTILGIRERISSAAAGLWDGIVGSFKAAINTLIRLWNNFHLTLGGGSILGISIPSVTLDTPNLPYLAAGGIVPATPGGRLAVLGEGGQDEAVVPLSKLPSLTGGSGGTFELGSDGSRMGDALLFLLAQAIRKKGGSPKLIGLKI